MRSVSELIRAHEREMASGADEKNFLALHYAQIRFLQHERLVHLLVMLAVIFFMLAFFVLFVFLQDLPYLGLFVILALLAFFYVFHYFKLENTVICWYFVYNEKLKAQSPPPGHQP